MTFLCLPRKVTCSWSWSGMQCTRGFGPLQLSSHFLSFVCQSRLLCSSLGPAHVPPYLQSFPCETHISVHPSLTLLPHKVALRYLPGHEHLSLALSQSALYPPTPDSTLNQVCAKQVVMAEYVVLNEINSSMAPPSWSCR